MKVFETLEALMLAGYDQTVRLWMSTFPQIEQNLQIIKHKPIDKYAPSQLMLT